MSRIEQAAKLFGEASKALAFGATVVTLAEQFLNDLSEEVATMRG